VNTVAKAHIVVGSDCGQGLVYSYLTGAERHADCLNLILKAEARRLLLSAAEAVRDARGIILRVATP